MGTGPHFGRGFGALGSDFGSPSLSFRGDPAFGPGTFDLATRRGRSPSPQPVFPMGRPVPQEFGTRRSAELMRTPPSLRGSSRRYASPSRYASPQHYASPQSYASPPRIREAPVYTSAVPQRSPRPEIRAISPRTRALSPQRLQGPAFAWGAPQIQKGSRVRARSPEPGALVWPPTLRGQSHSPSPIPRVVESRGPSVPTDRRSESPARRTSPEPVSPPAPRWITGERPDCVHTPQLNGTGVQEISNRSGKFKEPNARNVLQSELIHERAELGEWRALQPPPSPQATSAVAAVAAAAPPVGYTPTTPGLLEQAAFTGAQMASLRPMYASPTSQPVSPRFAASIPSQPCSPSGAPHEDATSPRSPVSSTERYADLTFGDVEHGPYRDWNSRERLEEAQNKPPGTVPARPRPRGRERKPRDPQPAGRPSYLEERARARRERRTQLAASKLSQPTPRRTPRSRPAAPSPSDEYPGPREYRDEYAYARQFN